MQAANGGFSSLGSGQPKRGHQKKVAILTSGGDSAGMNAAGEFSQGRTDDESVLWFDKLLRCE